MPPKTVSKPPAKKLAKQVAQQPAKKPAQPSAKSAPKPAAPAPKVLVKPAPKPAAPASKGVVQVFGKPAAKPVAKPLALAAPKQPPAKSVVPKPAAPKPAAPTSNAPTAPKAAAATPPALSTECQQRSLANMRAFFDRTLAAIEESASGFTPMPGMFSAAQQVAHTAQTVDWFLEGAFSPTGFKMDFPAMEAEVRKVTSLAVAKRWLDEAYGRFERALKERPAAQWHECIAKDTIMGGAPRWSVVDGLADHTAHHRGSLAVYARLLGKTPAMPYM